MRVLVDTNILPRSAQPTHPLRPQATHAVSTLLRLSSVRRTSPNSDRDLVYG